MEAVDYQDTYADDSDPVICRCLQVTEGQVRLALATLGPCTLRDLRRETGAGDGCTACHRRLKDFLACEGYSTASCPPSCSVR